VLKRVCEDAGFANARTYLQSGNVVFDSDDPSHAAKKLRDALKKAAKLDVGVIVRTPKELRGVIAQNPFGDAAEKDPGRLLVVFLEDKPAATAKEALDKLRVNEETHFRGRELYAYFPDGAGRSKLAAAFTEKKLGTMCTARNWNTVTALLAMAESD
jgi:uncharacterized protein (DUF1697 family)